MTWGNERLRRQFGWFTDARLPFRTLEEYVVSMNAPTALRKLTLPATEAELVLEDLDLMGINARVLLVDLAGAARNAFMRTVRDG